MHVHKWKRSKVEVENYWPISLLPVIGRLLEKNGCVSITKLLRQGKHHFKPAIRFKEKIKNQKIKLRTSNRCCSRQMDLRGCIWCLRWCSDDRLIESL